MIAQGDFFLLDKARHYLGLALWWELHRAPALARHFRGRANHWFAESYWGGP